MCAVSAQRWGLGSRRVTDEADTPCLCLLCLEILLCPAQLVLTTLTNLKDLSLYRNPDISDALMLKSSIMAMTNLTALDLRETGIGGE